MTDFKATLLATTRKLKDASWQEAVDLLKPQELVALDRAEALLCCALWERIVRLKLDPLTEKQRPVEALGAVRSAIMDKAHVWSAFRALPELEDTLGAENAAGIIANTLWSRCLETEEALFVATFELFFRGADHLCLPAFQQFLKHRKDYAPTYWHVALLMKLLAPAGDRGHAASVADLLKVTQRRDLGPLFKVYLMQMKQQPVAEILGAAERLPKPSHRLRVAQYMTGMGYLPNELPLVVSSFPRLIGSDHNHSSTMDFMKARLAICQGEWETALECARSAQDDLAFSDQAQLLAAKAHAHLGRRHDADEILEKVTSNTKLPPHLHARAAFIRLSSEILDRHVSLPEHRQMELEQTSPGKPIAQSLWVGRSLRWIERLAIKSYLDNGWRFQLYVYSDPDNVPAGCEVLDANAIIPEREVFKEGPGSGLHAGSIGAFSDLFRYKLLHDRGGLWTDTDVINLQSYEPDGKCFLATEITDAGFVTTNGALMAMPPGDPFVAEAYRRAEELLHSNRMFFTRIGPYLLAELLTEAGLDHVDLMPPHFLSAVFWMNTGSLLATYESVSKRADISRAINLHVYTEMWRLLGLGLETPPDPATFLGTLYYRHFPDELPIRTVALA